MLISLLRGSRVAAARSAMSITGLGLLTLLLVGCSSRSPAPLVDGFWVWCTCHVENLVTHESSENSFRVCIDNNFAAEGHAACTSRCSRVLSSTIDPTGDRCELGMKREFLSSPEPGLAQQCRLLQTDSTYLGSLQKSDAPDTVPVRVTLADRIAGQISGTLETEPFRTNICGFDIDVPAGLETGVMRESVDRLTATGELRVDIAGGTTLRAAISANDTSDRPCFDARIEVDPDPFFCGTSYFTGRLCMPTTCGELLRQENITGDFNGDGRIDVITWRESSRDWAVSLSTSSGFTYETWQGAWGSDGPIHVGDFDGDGKSDLVMWRDARKDWTVNLSTGKGFNFQVWQGAWGSDGPIQVGDFNGDGRSDVMMWRDAKKDWTVNLSTGSGFKSQVWQGAWGSDGPIRVGDFNRDGRSDVMMWRDAKKDWTVNLSTGSGFNFQVWQGAWGSDGPIHVGDFNGDGRSDVMMWRDARKDWTVNLSTGSGFNFQVWQGAWGSDGPIHVGDFNGDGRSDVLMWRGAKKDWTVNLSNGRGFDFRVWSGEEGSQGPIRTGDLNGDGKSDILIWRAASRDWAVNLATPSGFTSRIISKHTGRQPS